VWAKELIWTERLEKKSLATAGDRTPAVQSVVRHCTASDTPAPDTTYVTEIIVLDTPGMQWTVLLSVVLYRTMCTHTT